MKAGVVNPNSTCPVPGTKKKLRVHIYVDDVLCWGDYSCNYTYDELSPRGTTTPAAGKEGGGGGNRDLAFGGLHATGYAADTMWVNAAGL